MFPIKRTVFLCTVTVLKNTVRLIGNIGSFEEFRIHPLIVFCNDILPADK